MGYDEWMKRYKAQGLDLQENLSRTITQATEDVLDQPGTDLVDVNHRLRALRPTFQPRFCLLLYARSTDDKLMRAAWTATGSTDEVELTTADSISSGIDLGKSMTALMTVLDSQCGVHLVMLERGDTSDLEGPVRLNPSGDLWFKVMSNLAELAWVIIIIGKFGPNLIRELRYLSDAGLRGRVLFFFGQTLQHEGPAGELTQWSLEEIGSAVREAAESQIRPPDRERIDTGY